MKFSILGGSFSIQLFFLSIMTPLPTQPAPKTTDWHVPLVIRITFRNFFFFKSCQKRYPRVLTSERFGDMFQDDFAETCLHVDGGPTRVSTLWRNRIEDRHWHMAYVWIKYTYLWLRNIVFESHILFFVILLYVVWYPWLPGILYNHFLTSMSLQVFVYIIYCNHKICEPEVVGNAIN